MKYIFEVTINPGCSEPDYVDTWIEESQIIQREPGAMGTRLHRRIDEPGKLIAIASWESKQHRDAAMERLRDNPEVQAMRRRQQELVQFRLIGEVNEPEWQVLPGVRETRS